MTGKEFKLAALAVVAALAAALGIKLGKRGADKRVGRVADKAADKMKQGIGERLEDDLDDINSRPDGGNADWVEDQLRGRTGSGGRAEDEPKG